MDVKKIKRILIVKMTMKLIVLAIPAVIVILQNSIIGFRGEYAFFALVFVGIYSLSCVIDDYKSAVVRMIGMKPKQKTDNRPSLTEVYDETLLGIDKALNEDR